MRIRVKAIVPRRLLFDAKRLDAAVERGLDEAAKEVRLDFDETVSSWDTYVPFMTLSRTGERTISTKSLIYHFVNDGTKPHKITAKKAKALVFAIGGAAKTRPGLIASGQGHPGGAIAFAKSVLHPGTKPRKFNKAIQEKWSKLLPKTIQAAINDAL